MCAVTDEEVALLWDNTNIPFADMILIGIYSGWRPQELSILKVSNIDMETGTRHTFITKAKACNMDEYILKLIVGHSIEDITEKVYTHRTIEQLKAEMDKITK